VLAVTTARLDRLGDLATTTTLGLGGLRRRPPIFQLAGNASNESLELSKEGHFGLSTYENAFFRGGDVHPPSWCGDDDRPLSAFSGLSAMLTTTRSGRGREVRRGVGRSGLGRKESKGVPPLLVRGIGGDVRRRGGGHRVINYL